ncbi:MAG: GTPase HflX [Myxococcota bacterium]|nr:GTPase HflX [Myxococcota bacterium]
MLEKHTTTGAEDRAILVGLYTTDSRLSPELRMGELGSLVTAANGSVVGRVAQRRGLSRGEDIDRPVDAATYIGKGKVEDVRFEITAHDANLVVFDNELSPAQIRELEKRLQCRVIDRSELILDIFAARARTREAMLQVELAQLQYTAPRLRGMWSHLERQAGGGGGKSGGIGTRGPGEQQIEIDRRIVQKRIALLKHELEQVMQRRERQVSARNGRVWTVGLVGYTNAGKSTLLNTLTGAGAFAADLLFATLDTVSRRWAVRPGVDIPVSDTVGFVRDLPHHLVASFRSTLAEALHADLLLHVVDASHPEAESQVQAVKHVLAELGVDNDQVLGVLNKVDRVPDGGTLAVLRAEFAESVQVSARDGTGLDALADRVIARRSGDWTELCLHVPHEQARLAALVHEHGEVLQGVWLEDGWHARVSVPRAVVWQLESCLGAEDDPALLDPDDEP